MRYVWLFLSVFLLTSCSSPVSTEENPRTTTLSVAVPESGHVQVWIENAYQTNIKTVVDQQLQKGSHTFSFKMEDKNGDPLPYGIYTYYIRTENHSISRTFVYSNPNDKSYLR